MYTIRYIELFLLGNTAYDVTYIDFFAILLSYTHHAPPSGDNPVKNTGLLLVGSLLDET